MQSCKSNRCLSLEQCKTGMGARVSRTHNKTQLVAYLIILASGQYYWRIIVMRLFCMRLSTISQGRFIVKRSKTGLISRLPEMHVPFFESSKQEF
jgi:hypothetical protein